MLTGPAIHAAVTAGDITIDPFDERQLCANSYAFRLGDELLRYSPPGAELNPRADNPVTRTPIPDTGYVLEPETLYLGATREVMGGTCYAATLHACRSVSSLGLRIQLSAPLGHCGAVIPWTLELRSAQAVRVYPGMTIGKIAFWPMQGRTRQYGGRYSGSGGAVAAGRWLPFAVPAGSDTVRRTRSGTPSNQRRVTARGPTAMSSIDVIILTYNSARLLPEAIASVRAQTVADQVKITVIDNASADDTLTVARDLGINPIANPTNIGFAAAINAAVETGYGDYVAILNPDAALGDPKCLEALRATLDDKQIGVVGTRMITDGKPYPNGRRFPSTTTAARHAVMGILRPGNTATQEYFGDAFGRADADQLVDWVSGCCLMMRRPLWEEMGGFDERYWMYLEDCDLCWRLRQRGYRTVLSGPAWVIHHGGQSSRTRKTKSLWHHHRSAVVFYANTRTGWKRALLPAATAFLAVRLGVLVAVSTVRRFTART